ncbi:MAG: oligosaccharide flippase family protein, partial [Candidatus Methylomirabilis sp.]|nr:oligosaccharide flippase family protein [Deltaproteobacteria bacterium]
FFVGATLPRIVVEWFLMSAATIVLVPLLTQAASRYGEEEVRHVANTFMTLSLLFVGVVSVLAFAFAPAIARAIAPGLGEDVHRLSAGILRLLMATSIFSGVGAMFRGVLHAERKFVLPAAAMNLQGLVSIAFVLALGSAWGVWSVAAGAVAGTALYAFILFYPISETHHRFRLELDLEDPVVRRIMALFLPFLIIGIGAQINFLSDRWFASFLSEGAVSIMTYADKIKTPLLGIFAVSVTTPMYTIFSEHSAAEDLGRLRETVRQGMRAISLISLPVVAIFLALREPTIRFLLERGAFLPGDTATLAHVMLFYGPALVTWSFGILLMHAIFSTQDVYWAVWI